MGDVSISQHHAPDAAAVLLRQGTRATLTHCLRELLESFARAVQGNNGSAWQCHVGSGGAGRTGGGGGRTGSGGGRTGSGAAGRTGSGGAGRGGGF